MEADAAEFTAYEQNLQLVRIDQGAAAHTDQMVVVPANDTGLALTSGTDLSLVHVSAPSFQFKQLDANTNLNTAPTALQRQVHMESLMRTSRKQMSLRLHGSHVELAGCGDEYGYEDFQALPQTTFRRPDSHSSSSSQPKDDIVHFLGPAENIKTLFKMPYSHTRVSLAIHRVGNTLIVDGEVDEKDLPRGFDACNEVLQINHTDQSSNRTFLPSSDVSSSHLFDNFIYQSTQLLTPPPPPALPTPQQAISCPTKHKRKVQLQKRDRHPDVLFSNKDHPAVSLKLHDVNEELSLCTALDYYLDNVQIANIPELAICMHSNGYVRGYQLLQTRDIPHLNGSPSHPLFDIQDVNMNATMLLRFLQSNGTYWLFREEGSRSLRLYDVRMLSQGKQRKWKYMMAMLCYRFATRAGRLIFSAKESPSLQHRLRVRQRELLATCLDLLDEIRSTNETDATSAYRTSSKAQDSISATVAETMADTYLRDLSSLTSHDAIDALTKAIQHLVHSIHVLEGCLLHHMQDRDLVENTPASPVADFQDGTEDDDDYDDDVGHFVEEEVLRLKLKHSSTCLQLAAVYLENQRHSDTIAALVDACKYMPSMTVPTHPRHVIGPVTGKLFFTTLVDELDFGGVSKANKTGRKLCHSMEECRASVLEAVGDVANVLDPHQDSANVAALIHVFTVVGGGILPSDSYTEGVLSSVFVKTRAASETAFQLPLDVSDTKESLLYIAFFAYLYGLDPQVTADQFVCVLGRCRPQALTTRFSVLVKKLGNAANEFGKFYMRCAAYSRAYLWFEGGSLIFDAIEDGINVALIYANLANLHKVLAEKAPSSVALSHYTQAIELCQKAQSLLKQAKASAELHVKVNGELALTYLVWAVHLSVVAKEAPVVLEKFYKALNMYVDLGDRRQVAATHYQMATYYSQRVSNGAVKQRLELARRHYEKALEYFGAVEVGTTFVLIHKELAQLYASSTKVNIEHALLVMLNTFDAYKHLDKLPPHEQANLNALVPTLLQTLQGYLLQLVKSGSKHHTDRFKAMYRATIYTPEQQHDSFSHLLLTLRNLYE
ncbi:hypothetical protein DYB32_004685 [Aphanomyces invadans]|uniref:EDRF1 N-terminal domain-containing protein n=1 Tax=Aphanomyces invadans TaxID=157072 RepID=A0A418AWY7_9STRA|nr:hypothetical protein DYB32_004685 [Aphanomyces invadans]